MDLVTTVATQLRELWSRWNTAQRAGIVTAFVVSVIAVTGVGFWASSPEYVTVADRLSPQQAADVVSTLESSGLRYRLNYAGSSILVSKSDLNRARLALKDIITVKDSEEPTISEGIWSDPTLHQVRLTRQLESRLARSISQLASVKSATVHLSKGETTPFMRQRPAAKASVVLELAPHTALNAADARAIASMVAHSVENLDVKDVSILDTHGRMLSSSQGLEGDVTGQLSYRTQIEADLASKAEAILTQMLGPGKAVVRVTADIDFTETQSKEVRYDPELKVKVSETTHSESVNGASRPAKSGPVGATPNLDALAFKAGGGSGGSKMETNTTTYENAKTEDTVHRAPGRITRLSVAAVVQLPEAPAAAGTDPAAAAVPAAPLVTREQVEKIIRQAVGFDATRNDAIEVLSAPLAGNQQFLEPLPVASPWDQYGNLLKNLSLGIASIVALVVGFLVLRRMQPIVLEQEVKGSLPSDMVLRIADLSRQAQEEPETVATIIRSWLEEPSEQRPTQRVA